MRGAKGAIDFTARIGPAGRAHAAGLLVTQPFAIDWQVDLGSVDLLPLRSYFESRTNVIATSGAMTAKGRLTYAGTSPAGPAAGFAGNVTISDFGALDRPTAQELVRWKSAHRRRGRGDATESCARRDSARPVLRAAHRQPPDGTLNLQRLPRPGADGAPPPTAPPAGKGGVAGIPTSIGDIKMSHGEVQFRTSSSNRTIRRI